MRDERATRPDSRTTIPRVPGFRGEARLARMIRPYWLLLALSALPASAASVGAFQQASDVGPVARPVEARFDSAAGAYVISAGGENMWGTHDAFGYAWKTARGDLSLMARVELQGASPQSHRKAGVMFRVTMGCMLIFVL